jgi:hypothetical protein
VKPEGHGPCELPRPRTGAGAPEWAFDLGTRAPVRARGLDVAQEYDPVTGIGETRRCQSEEVEE